MTSVAEIRIEAVSRSTEIDIHGRGNLEAVAATESVTISGWAFGRDRIATEVEFLSEDGSTIARVPISQERPDVVLTVGDLPGALRSGFGVTLEPRLPGLRQIQLQVVFDEGAPAALGTVELEAELELDSSGETDGEPPWIPSISYDDHDRVLIGKEGWLFLRGDSNDAIGQLTGEVTLSEAATEMMRIQTERRKSMAEKMGCTWLTAVVPDKEALYREFLPSEITPVARRPVHDVLETAESVGASMIYLLDALTAAKVHGDLYIKTDTHWNHRGAFAGYAAICRQLRTLGVTLTEISEDSISWWEAPVQGDLGGKLYPTPLESVDVTASLAASWGRRVWDNKVRNHGRVLICEQEREDRPTCLVFGESFVPTLLFFLKESFGRVVFVHTSMFIQDLVEIEQPDVVLSIPIERFLIHVPDDTDALTKLQETVRAKGGELPWSLEGVTRSP